MSIVTLWHNELNSLHMCKVVVNKVNSVTQEKYKKTTAASNITVETNKAVRNKQSGM